MNNRNLLVPTFLLVILAIGIIAEIQHLPSAIHIISFALAASAWFIRRELRGHGD